MAFVPLARREKPLYASPTAVVAALMALSLSWKVYRHGSRGGGQDWRDRLPRDAVSPPPGAGSPAQTPKPPLALDQVRKGEGIAPVAFARCFARVFGSPSA